MTKYNETTDNTNDNETATDTTENTNDTKDTESDTNTDNITYTLDNLKNRYAIKDDCTENCHYVYVKTWCKDDKKRVYIKDYKNRYIGYIDAVNGDIKIDNRQGIYADELDYALINIIADMTNHITDNTESNNKTSAELKAEINNKYGVNAVYYDTDSILCDAEKQNICVHQNKATDNEVYATTTKIIVRDVCKNDEVCTITPYENGKELTTPIPEMKCLTNVIDYVTRLYDMNVVTRETYFKISRVGKRDVILTYTNTHNIVQYYNISDKMQSLATTAIEKYGYYSKYTRKPLKSRQYDTLELYKKGIYLTVTQCNDDENVIKDWYCDITYKSVHHIAQYTYKELLHLIDIIRFNTQEYCDKYFDWGDTKWK